MYLYYLVEALGRLMLGLYIISIFIMMLTAIVENKQKRKMNIFMLFIQAMIITWAILEREYFKVVASEIMLIVLICVFAHALYVLVDALSKKSNHKL